MIKDEKILNLNSSISLHDLQSKIKNLMKWLEKKHQVKVIIAGDTSQSVSVITSTAN